MNGSSNYEKHTQAKGLRKKLIDRFNLAFTETINPYISETSNILDVGCGEGFMLKLIHENHPKSKLIGCDLSPKAIEKAKIILPNFDFYVSDGYCIDFPDKTFDVVVCTEVLEHVYEPAKMLAEIKRLSQRYVLLTVPHEPFFRLGNLISGKYLSTLGNHPEHVKQFGKSKFRSLCNEYFEEIRCASVFPWLMYVGRVVV